MPGGRGSGNSKDLQSPYLEFFVDVHLYGARFLLQTEKMGRCQKVFSFLYKEMGKEA